MLAQLTLTMALDMDLEKAKPVDEESEEACDMNRTLIGVYYFSSCTSLVMRKPITLKHSFALWNSARSLAAANKAPSDPLLIHYVTFQGLAEEIADNFGYINESGRHLLSMSDLESVEIRVNAFNERLQQLRVSIPQDTPVSSSLLFTSNSVAVYLHEVALHIPTVTKEDVPIQPQAIAAYSNLLWACLRGMNLFYFQFALLLVKISPHYSLFAHG